REGGPGLPGAAPPVGGEDLEPKFARAASSTQRAQRRILTGLGIRRLDRLATPYLRIGPFRRVRVGRSRERGAARLGSVREPVAVGIVEVLGVVEAEAQAGAVRADWGAHILEPPPEPALVRAARAPGRTGVWAPDLALCVVGRIRRRDAGLAVRHADDDRVAGRLMQERNVSRSAAVQVRSAAVVHAARDVARVGRSAGRRAAEPARLAVDRRKAVAA